MENDGLILVAPRVRPVLDSGFRPAVLANRDFQERVRALSDRVPVWLALEQADGSVSSFATDIFPESHPESAANFAFIERLVKFLLWSRGGFRIHFTGLKSLAERLRRHFGEMPTGRFDSNLVGESIYGRPIEVVCTDASRILPACTRTQSLGGHFDGCRIGFDLGGSDRKVAAVVDGKVVFSAETVWDPYHQSDPNYHFDGIMDSLRTAAGHLPRVDAIGGSAAGVYVHNRVKVASLFRAVPQEVFRTRVTNLFFEIQREWNGVPLDVINDGEVAALAGSMALGRNAVLGLALGTSLAGGYVDREGKITSWLNELAFAPVDYSPLASRDEWSGDYGVGVQYFSQQAVGRLMAAAGISVDPQLPLPEKLKQVQELMANGDERAQKIYQTIGTYLGYATAHYADFYDFDYVLLLGRVVSGRGGDVIVHGAKEVLALEFPDLAERIVFHMPDEKDKRHGQAVAAASLPIIPDHPNS